ncbi:unnamed protein product [Symbiodinium necroappetens]|uniref:Uncharacterized protein n=1 Tax=Symbiodinium necroappetens TaxID=1628268 RepID=A0A812Q6J4_9DINO|nr:unnamed protein product [Symbiodinium necroappetens]
MRLLRLELSLGPVPQVVQLADGLEGSGGLGEGTLPTQRFTLPLPDDARVLGFRYWEVGGSGSCIAKDGAEAAACRAEATDPTTGFADRRDIHILLDVQGKLQLEPLSRRYIRSNSIKFPGRLAWMPPALESLEKEPESVDIPMLPEVTGLRTIQGTVDHIVECQYEQSWTCTLDAVRSLTGQSAMFWADLFLLTLALFYVDIALDVKQLGLFWQNKLFGYFFLNVAGMALPPVFTTLEAVDFLDRRSPEEDQLKTLLTPKMLVPAMLLSICTQTHMRHPLLAGAKHAEVAESAVSALVQTNFLVSALGGIAQIEALELPDEELNSMKISVLVSCFSLGLGFASRDKADSAVLELPGKVGWGPTMGGLVLARSLEVFSRILALNVLQASLRGLPLLRFAGVGAVALAFLAACLAFPDASWADAAAAVIAHPGQILEPNSLLKWRYSFIIHFLLVAAAGGGQLLLRTSTVLPDMLLIAWLVPGLTCPSQSQVVSFVSWAALGLLSWLGHHVEQPRFVALASGDEPVIAYSSLQAGLPSPDGQVPKAVLAAMQGKVAVDLTTDAAARGLTQQGLERILESTGDVRFDGGLIERLAIPQEAVVEGVATLHPATLHLPDFVDVPADSWERLGASLDSERLRKANLDMCFRDSGEGSKPLLAALARCRKLKDPPTSEFRELAMYGCMEVPGEAWAELGAAEWPELRKASFGVCFYSSGSGSEELLAALGRSQQLEEVDFRGCDQIPDAAWELLGDGAWPRLRVAFGIPEEHLERLRKAPLDLEAGAGEVASSLELQEPGAKQLPMYPTFVTSVVMLGAGGAAAVQGDLGLLPALARSDVEELNLDECRDVPAAVWQQLGQGEGRGRKGLRRLSLERCFDEHSKGGEGAAGLLLALSRCQLLQELQMGYCSQIPAAAWQQLKGAHWPKLTKVDVDRRLGFWAPVGVFWDPLVEMVLGGVREMWDRCETLRWQTPRPSHFTESSWCETMSLKRAAEARDSLGTAFSPSAGSGASTKSRRAPAARRCFLWPWPAALSCRMRSHCTPNKALAMM